jgi:pyrroline-5-carboxylate reductase
MPEIARLLQGLGHLIQLENESDLDAFWSTTGLMSSYFGLLGEMAGWLSRQNLEETQVRIFVASLFEALGTTASERAGAGFDQLIAQHTTAGGLNEQAWRELRAAGWPRLFSEALDLIHARVLGKAAFADRLPGNREST